MMITKQLTAQMEQQFKYACGSMERNGGGQAGCKKLKQHNDSHSEAERGVNTLEVEECNLNDNLMYEKGSDMEGYLLTHPD